MTTICLGNLGVAKNSRIANKYAMPATAREAMKYGPPRSAKEREQIVSATHNVAPSRYTLRTGVRFTFTGLPCPSYRLLIFSYSLALNFATIAVMSSCCS